MNIRGILLDFDGTSLQRDQVYLSFCNMHALEEAMERGIEIIPCTGRCEDMFPPQIEAEKRIHYWVTANGGRVVDRLTGEVIYSSLFTPEESSELCRIFEEQNIYSEISAEGKIYMEESICRELYRYAVPPHHVWFMDLGRQIPIARPSEFFLQNRIGIEKVNIYGVPKEKQKGILDALEATGFASITEGAGTDIQFFPKRQKRADAMDALFKRLGYGFENVMSLGDSLLDKRMIELAGIGVAMGNAPDSVKAVADYVTTPYYENGVAEAITRFLLN